MSLLIGKILEILRREGPIAPDCLRRLVNDSDATGMLGEVSAQDIRSELARLADRNLVERRAR